MDKERLINFGEWALPPPFQKLFLQAVEQDLYTTYRNEYQWVLKRKDMFDIFFWFQMRSKGKVAFHAWQWTRRNDWDPNFWEQIYTLRGG